MRTYRVFTLDESGHFFRAGISFDALDDYAAIEKADQYTSEHDVELWEGARLVKILRRKK